MWKSNGRAGGVIHQALQMVFETQFGWVLAGGCQNDSADKSTNSVVTFCHLMVSYMVDILQRFWEVPPNTQDHSYVNPRRTSCTTTL